MVLLRRRSTLTLDAMADALILLFAGLGLIGIILGIKAGRYASRSTARAPGAAPWKWIRAGAVAVGFALATGSLVLATGLSYSVTTPEGPGRIVGWPFFVAYFDETGHDYVGFLTLLGGLDNFLFWFLVPQFMFAAYVRIIFNRHGV
jgi:hypothetical protein